MRATVGLLAPDTHAAWLDGTREAFGHLDSATRAIVAQLARELLALAEDAERADASPLAVRAS
jgi:hypothetical protein